MLPPDNRKVLIDLLRAPPGARLAHAVATSFTLDLTAALVAPLAFASQRLHGKQDPIAVMEAVRSSAEHVDIFCQAGHVRVPARHSDLMAFLEPAVHEIGPPRPGRLFHPKLWLLLFESDEGHSLRFVVTTRNLTDDVSWDAAVRLDGEIGTRARASNAPLARLVRSLPEFARDPLPTARRERIDVLAETLRYAEWDELPALGCPTFHVLGMQGQRATPDFTGYRHLIVSPFINDEGLGFVVPNTRDSEVVLVSRPEELERLNPQTLGRVAETRIVSSLAGLGTADDSAVPAEDQDQPDDSMHDDTSLLGGGLHAKLYVVERNRAAHVFIGSANATDAAFDGNVEILVEFSAGATRAGVEVFLDHDTGMASLLEPYSATGGEVRDAEAEALERLQHQLRRLAALPWTAKVAAGGPPFDVDVRARQELTLPADVTCQLSLLTQLGRTRQVSGKASATFDGVPLEDVTPFLTVTLNQEVGGQSLAVSTVVRARLVNDPAGRLDAVLARQVDTPEKFLRFLLLLLGLGSAAAAVRDRREGAAGTWGLAGEAGTLEAIVRALAEEPSALEELDRLVARLRRTEEGRRILPDGFDAVWDEVLDAHRRLPRVLVTGART